MAHAGPLTSQEVAERSGAAERYVREWLGNQAAGGYVTYDPESDRYTLPDEHALAPADEDSPFYILGVYDSIASLYADEDQIFEAFRSGRSPGEADARRQGRRRRLRPRRVFYGASTVICTPASLDQEVGLALGAQAGEAALDRCAQTGWIHPPCDARPKHRST